MSTPTDATRERESGLLAQTCVVIVTYNHEEYINDCLESILSVDPGTVVVVDSGSTDGTVEIVENVFPEVTLIQPDENLGYGGANNRALEAVDSEYHVVMNPDTRIAADCLDKLVEPLSEADRIITVPKILTYEGREINTIGNTVHFSGLAFIKGYGERPEEYDKPQYLSGLSGACFATTRETFQELGGFEEAIFIYMEDVELSWKANAMDVDIRYVPEAVVFHDYPGVHLDADKLFHLERGRYIILRKYLGVAGAALVFPSLLLTELLTWGYALLHGKAGVQSKVKAIYEGFTASVSSVDVDVPELLGRLDHQIPEDQLKVSPVVKRAIGITNKVYEANISLIRR